MFSHLPEGDAVERIFLRTTDLADDLSPFLHLRCLNKDSNRRYIKHLFNRDDLSAILQQENFLAYWASIDPASIDLHGITVVDLWHWIKTKRYSSKGYMAGIILIAKKKGLSPTLSSSIKMMFPAHVATLYSVARYLSRTSLESLAMLIPLLDENSCLNIFNTIIKHLPHESSPEQIHIELFYLLAKKLRIDPESLLTILNKDNFCAHIPSKKITELLHSSLKEKKGKHTEKAGVSLLEPNNFYRHLEIENAIAETISHSITNQVELDYPNLQELIKKSATPQQSFIIQHALIINKKTDHSLDALNASYDLYISVVSKTYYRNDPYSVSFLSIMENMIPSYDEEILKENKIPASDKKLLSEIVKHTANFIMEKSCPL